jgi:hypothetical protein
MADSVKGRFRVAWNKEEDPHQGFRYLYLTKEDYAELNHAVNAELLMEVMIIGWMGFVCGTKSLGWAFCMRNEVIEGGSLPLAHQEGHAELSHANAELLMEVGFVCGTKSLPVGIFVCDTKSMGVRC